MKVSYNWLKDYADISSSAIELSEILTNTGLEVEEVTKLEAVKGGLLGVVVGLVCSCEPHPNADKLKVTQVDIGTGDLLSIVCGAPNVSKGQKVAVATVGTVLYPEPENPLKIKRSKIRGVESQGMLCAEDELGLGENHEGILVLPQSAPIGSPLSKILDIEDDYILEIGLTPNRSDAMGHIGVLRDYVAYQNVHKNKNLRINWPEIPDLQAYIELDSSKKVNITVEDPELCPKYSGLTISNVLVGPSPDWLQTRLRSIGLSPINNVVDCTNFVLFELGTPLHAFDCAILGGKIVVKTAKQGDKFTTLDGREHELSSTNLMITNGEKNIGIAGVFGGLSSGISEKTTNIFLESAYFDPVCIRKTAKELGISTDASFRYERGTDPQLVEYALERCASLIIQTTGGKIAMEKVVVGEIESKRTINFNYFRNNQLIGAKINKNTVDLILKNLDFDIKPIDDQQCTLRIPSYRTDVTRQADVSEEVLRIYGFNQVSLPDSMKLSLTHQGKMDDENAQKMVSTFLVSTGFYELVNNSLSKSTYISTWIEEQKNEQIYMLNPLSQDLNVMRMSLLFGILEAITHNQNRQNSDLQFFEFGKTYKRKGTTYLENKRLLLALSGRKTPENWIDHSENHNFYSIKGLLWALFCRLGINQFVSEKNIIQRSYMEGVEIFIQQTKIGELGSISKQLKDEFGIKNDVFIADLDWDLLVSSLKMKKTNYKELPKTFYIRRDFSLLVDLSVQYAQIKEIALKTDKKLLKEIGLFDVYEGEKIPKGKKSYAVFFIFQHAEQTLQDSQIDAIMNTIYSNLNKQLGAELR